MADINPLINAADLAEKLTPMLLPLLPYLLKGVKTSGEKFLQALGEKSGEKAVEIAEQLWKKLKPKVDEKPEAQKVVEEAAEAPTRGYLPGALSYQLKEILEEDEALRQEIAALVSTGERKGLTIASFINAGVVYGEVTGIKVVNLEALEKAGLINSEIRADVVGRGGEVTGIEL